jgi:hypothetical protein
LHSYHSSRPRVDWNRCGQAAVATLLDHYGLDPYCLSKPIYDENDGHRHWADGEIIDRICEDFPPNHLFGLFGTTPGQLGKVLRYAGLEASWVGGKLGCFDEYRQGTPTSMGGGQAIGRSTLARHSLHGHGPAWRSSLECPLGRDLPSRRFLSVPGEYQGHYYSARGAFLARVRGLVHAPALPPLRRLRLSEDR